LSPSGRTVIVPPEPWEDNTVPAIPRTIDWVRERIPDLDARISQFETEPFELDDELIDAFCEELARLCGDLQTALQGEDAGKIQRAAHSLKGMCSSIGLPELAVLAQEIEFTLRDGETERCATLANDFIHWTRDFTGRHSPAGDGEAQRSL
jgi:HPt (histidine-containing phosphotransfer) domain-containing protein